MFPISQLYAGSVAASSISVAVPRHFRPESIGVLDSLAMQKTIRETKATMTEYKSRKPTVSMMLPAELKLPPLFPRAERVKIGRKKTLYLKYLSFFSQKST